MGNYHIGIVLSNLVVVKEEVEIPDILSMVIENIKNDDIGEGLFIGVINQRSLTSRSPFEGGKQEHNLYNVFIRKSEQIITKHPRTADILDRVANYYKDVAKREDEEAKQRELEY